jgi:hypothetical protein
MSQTAMHESVNIKSVVLFATNTSWQLSVLLNKAPNKPVIFKLVALSE